MGGIIEGAIVLGVAAADAAAAGAAAVGAMTLGEIGTAVALTGLGTSVVGMATGNKIMTEVGMGLGIAGGAVGLGAALTGGEAVAAGTDVAGATQESTALSEGIASSTQNATTPLVGSQDIQTSGNLAVSSNIDATAPITGSPDVVPGAQLGNNGQGADIANAVDNRSPLLPGEPGGSILNADSAVNAPPAPSVSAPSVTAPTAPGESAVPSNAFNATSPDQVASQTSSMIRGAGASNLSPAVQNAISQAGTHPGGIAGWWSALDPSMKAAIAITGGQAIAGGAGGLFQGLNAQQQLELQQLINSQNQAQRQYLNANNQYAPTLSFTNSPKPTGLIGQAGTR